MPTDFEWTPERIHSLTEMWAQKLSAREIGRRLGTTANAVTGKAHRVGLPKRGNPIVVARAALAEKRSKMTDAPLWRQQLRIVMGQARTAKTAHPRRPDIPAVSVRNCQFPLWANGERPTHRYCGLPVWTETPRPTPYCRWHHGETHEDIDDKA